MHSIFNIFKAIFFGFFTGLVISIPLGPAGIESVKRTISNGFKEGFKVSLGALSADMAYLLIINGGLSGLLAKNKKTEALFWIISGFILAIIGYISIKKDNSSSNIFNNKFSGNKSISIDSNKRSLPFLAGFLITFSNPMTPSLWLFMSGTVIRAWYYVSLTAYYTFIFSLWAGMVSWFAILNYLALKGINILTPSASKKTSALLMIGIFVIGLAFMIFGIIMLIR